MTLIQDAPSPNQAPPLQAYDVATNDRVLMEALDREGGEWAGDRVRELGEQAGRPETLDLGRLAAFKHVATDSGRAFGTLPPDTHFDEILERHRPQV
jgi:AidA-like protein